MTECVETQCTLSRDSISYETKGNADAPAHMGVIHLTDVEDLLPLEAAQLCFCLLLAKILMFSSNLIAKFRNVLVLTFDIFSTKSKM